jgi:hypothetical protein
MATKQHEKFENLPEQEYKHECTYEIPRQSRTGMANWLPPPPIASSFLRRNAASSRSITIQINEILRIRHIRSANNLFTYLVHIESLKTPIQGNYCLTKRRFVHPTMVAVTFVFDHRVSIGSSVVVAVAKR